MQHTPRSVPWFGQWESRDFVSTILAEGPEIALPRDPHWRTSGARSIEEYVTWASHVCGMACLKMILAARGGRIVPTLELARACTGYGGYTLDPHTGDIKGLVYAPFVNFVAQEFGIEAEVMTHLTAAQLPALLERAEFFIASVHPWIRWPDREPPSKGGHLVLVLGADAAPNAEAGVDVRADVDTDAGRNAGARAGAAGPGTNAGANANANATQLVFHNPSGDTRAAQEYATLDIAGFDRFFAGRGIAIFPARR